MSFRSLALSALAFFCLEGGTLVAQESDPFAPAQRLSEGWEEIDQRLIFLMVRLADVEANLDAIDQAMGKNRSRAAVATSQANRAEAGNERMDRRAGGPVRWDRFYGTTAEKFFYHPTDNHTYHTRTILTQQSPANDNQSGSGVPSRQGLPVHQRPPQFDYIYRANETAKERAIADISKLRGNVGALAARRNDLELEQSKLWCEVAFRAVSKNDLDRKPLYRYAPSDTEQQDLLAASQFVSIALAIVENGQKDQTSTFRQIKPMISKARDELGNRWLALQVNYRDESSDEWRFAALARRLEDVSSNLADSYVVSVDRDQVGDSERRDLYRGLLQQALIQYAETVLALDEMASEMALAREFKPNLDREITVPNFPPSPTNPPIDPPAAPAVEPKEQPTMATRSKRTRSRTGSADRNPRKDNWLLLIKDVESYRRHWEEQRGTAYFYDPKTNIISADGGTQYSLGIITAQEVWQEIYFEMGVEKLSFGQCTVIVNGKRFKIGHALKNARNGVPIRILYLPDEQMARLVVGNVVAAQTNVFQKSWNSSLKCEIFGGTSGHPSAIKVRNISILQAVD